MSPSFPRYFLLKSCYNSRYVQHVDELEEHKDFLVCDAQDIARLHSRFQVETSASFTNYFHIRCCYNNKYWAVDADGRIYAGEKQPVEDTSKPNCTLFQMKRGDNGKEGAFRLICKKVNQDVNFDLQYYNRSDSKLVLAAATPICHHDFIAIDWEALVALPQYLSFKGDNGKYLQVVDNQYLQYKADDRYHKSAIFEIFSTPDGRIRVKNDGKFWRAGPNWIYSDSESKDTDYSDPATLFMPFRIEKNVIAFRNMDNNYFCRRTTWDYHDDCLCADNAGITISREARIQVEEPVSSRKISDIRFREDNCRYYNESLVTMAKAFVFNDTKVYQEVGVELEYQHATSHNWTTSYLSSFIGSMKFTFQVPSFVGVNFQSSKQKDESYEWGRKKALVDSKNESVKVGVKPGTKVKVTVVAKRRHCDVPFSYTREDKLDDGTPITSDEADGVYTGVYCMDFDTKVEEV